MAIFLNEINFKACIVSEFGEELKGIRLQLVKMVQEIIDCASNDHTPAGGRLILPGDLTIVYDIESEKFLCHDTCEFEPQYSIQIIEETEPISLLKYRGSERTYLFRKDFAQSEARGPFISLYYERLEKQELSYFCGRTVV